MNNTIKKAISILSFLLIMMSFTSCLSMFINQPSVIDHGHFYKDVPALETSNVIVDENLTVTGIDDSSSIFATEVPGWKKKNYPSQLQTFKLNPGVHTISVKFESATQSAIFSALMIGLFEANKEYKIICEISDTIVRYNIVNTETNESVILDNDALSGKKENPISQFINAVLNPTMEGTDETVYEENDDYKITNLPHMKYELLDKKTGTISKGFRGFETDFTFKKGTVYLYETDSFESKDDFLNSNYKDESQIVLEVTDCDQKTVTYTYVKPESKAGETITFNIYQ